MGTRSLSTIQPKAECEMIQNVVKWLKALLELLKSIEESSNHDQESDNLMSSQKIENLILEGEDDNTREALTNTLFFPWEDEKTRVNLSYFHDKGGLDVLMKIYGTLVGKELVGRSWNWRRVSYSSGECMLHSCL